MKEGIIKPNLILVGGKKRTGKDTLTDLFKKGGYKQMAYADNLKLELEKILIEVYNIPREKIHLWSGDKESSLGIKLKDGKELTNRLAMQIYGQVMKHYFGKDHWTNKIIGNILTSSSGEFHGDLIISDVRFPYEIELSKKELSNIYNIHSIKMIRNTGLEDSDISENSLEDYKFDFEIDNNGTLERLKNNFHSVLRDINIKNKLPNPPPKRIISEKFSNMFTNPFKKEN